MRVKNRTNYTCKNETLTLKKLVNLCNVLVIIRGSYKCAYSIYTFVVFANYVIFDQLNFIILGITCYCPFIHGFISHESRGSNKSTDMCRFQIRY